MEFNPPPFATTDGWEEFEQNFRTNAPIRYRISELRSSIRRYGNKISHHKNRFYNRYISKTHLLEMEWVSKGTYHDSSEVMKYAIFQVIIDFVEKDLAQWSDSYKCNNNPFVGVTPSHIDGIKMLEQNIYSDELGEESKQKYRDILEIYLWAKDLSSGKFKEPEPPEQPWNDDDHGFMYFMTGECQEKYPEYHKLYSAHREEVDRIETARREYEEEMLQKALKVREQLWT